ncbi:hypothetical protein J1N35_037435 [Gossypium stocksii]|uniref:Uncharacterized protein n=1 Tax=Gossypium stocksii TaxID=47602 RepID=A0A9D3ZKX5_9ROSI|nr:hypothetical protein J1N35_037435 [Gossypium stocksii]
MSQRELHHSGKQRVVYGAVWSLRNSAAVVDEISISKGDASSKEMTNGSTEYERVTATPKFKRRKVSMVWDFSPGYKRGIASDFGLNRQIKVDQSNQGSGDYEYLVLYVARCVLLPYDSIV